eukprot:TRINITY_DN21299_c0_g1_i2.p1 TRINITY_DN21299_c0_g1~~TRINITY_DN21299_c0_g1_i2.p1  ORF type:complete len:234 (+),score=37.64 TRINITY_DN21299_c0_g1_i2:90-704(+)
MSTAAKRGEKETFTGVGARAAKLSVKLLRRWIAAQDSLTTILSVLSDHLSAAEGEVSILDAPSADVHGVLHSVPGAVSALQRKWTQRAEKLHKDTSEPLESMAEIATAAEQALEELQCAAFVASDPVAVDEASAGVNLLCAFDGWVRGVRLQLEANRVAASEVRAAADAGVAAKLCAAVQNFSVVASEQRFISSEDVWALGGDT